MKKGQTARYTEKLVLSELRSLMEKEQHPGLQSVYHAQLDREVGVFHTAEQ